MWTVLALLSLGCPRSAPVPTEAAEAPPPADPTEPVGTPFPIGPHLEATKLPGVPAWRITDTETIPANSLVVQTADGSTVLADTPFTPRATEHLLAWMQERFGAPPALATVSHYHFDASAGVEVLRAAGVRLAVSDRTAELLAAKGPGMQQSLASSQGDAFTGWAPPTAEATFALAEGVTHTVGGTEVQVLHPGPAHAPDNVVTWFPSLGVLFGGCMVKGGDDLGYLGVADVPAWPAAMRVLEALEPAVVVPGHGPRTDPQMLAHTREMAEQWTPADPATD